MKEVMKKSLRSLLKRCDIELIRHSTFQRLMQYRNSGADDIELLRALPADDSAQLLQRLRQSKSQLRQDLFVLSELRFKRQGYFVEFGATNGLDLSNTHLLEKEFGWSGILAEPGRCWHTQLRHNRQCHIEIDCVWSDSVSVLPFKEAQTAELSTLNAFSSADAHAEARKAGKEYHVRTISLLDLLEKYQAPREIDYLSIDTEGSELEILKNFDFTRYRFNVVTCEHNFTPARQEIASLLVANGYVRKFENLSRFDDWYVRAA
jgi:FkbM family methyltransferase